MPKEKSTSDSVGNVSRTSRKSITLDVKLQVLRRLEAGERQVDVGRDFNLATSTIRTILKNAEKIKASRKTTTSFSATKLTRSRSSLLEKMEKELCMWVEDQMHCRIPLSQFMIMEKARSIFNHLKEQEGKGSTLETFTASRGWFLRFKRRSNLQNIHISGEASRADDQATQEYTDTLSAIMSGKRSASHGVDSMSKLSRKSITLDVKMQVLRRLEAGERQVDVGRDFNLATSTIRTILRNAEKIKASRKTTTSFSATKLTRSRSSLLEKMEKELCIWVEDQLHRRISLSQLMIMEKARSIFTHLQEQEGKGSTLETFTASRGWFFRFKRRSNLQNIHISGEASCADDQAAQEYTDMLRAIIKRGNYPPQLVFNVDETGLFWKRMPSCTFISQEEKCASGFKAAKDRLMLLLGGNAIGDLKLKPMLVYHARSLRVMEGFSSEHLPLIWRANKVAWITITIFHQWFTSYFCPTVKSYCEENNLELKALLVLDSTPGHPLNLESLPTCLPVEVVYLPANTTSPIQPMDQGVISNFKAYYLRCIFKQLSEITDGQDKQSIREFWRSYNMMKAIENISASWAEVTSVCMNNVWRKLWPEVCGDSVGCEEGEQVIISDIVQLAAQAGLDEVDADDVVELLRSHGDGLTNEELQELEQYCVCVQTEDTESTETPAERNLSIAILMEGIKKIEEGLELFSANDPDWERSLSVRRIVLDSISCYREMLSERERQARPLSLGCIIKEEPQPGPSAP
ncbi:tigger transposable element-derived protein 1-like [Pristis pectinata]|uniref:tigger transposable element-derived protein 1-like n=1 Tax=Pristis pectinata TaxID=685728 RepID=UPI00223C9EC2|nr:tigger transposable element-derived protein 1-like [Pristis pectinata]